MSKQNEKKEEGPRLDIQAEMKLLSYTVTLKDGEINDLVARNRELVDSLVQLKQEKHELRTAYVGSLKTEKTIKNMQEHIDNLERELEKLKEEKRNREREFSEEMDSLKTRYEADIHKLKNALEVNEKKFESVNILQNLCEKQEGQIKQLEWEKDKVRTKADDKIKHKEIRNQIKFSELKKKMMENIQDTQKNVTQLNIEYMDVSTKLTLLQNHQLLIELEYQSQQIEELIKKKENLEKKVFELTQDIEVHKEVELALAAKNKKLSEKVKVQGEHESLVSTYLQNDSTSKPLYVNSSVKEFTMVNVLERKVLKLESALKKKGEDLLKLKNNFDFLEDRLKNYEKKFAGVFNLFEEGLKRFNDDEELINNRDIFINLDNIKKCDFSQMSSKEQYSVIVLLMKYLIPLLNPHDLKKSEFGNGYSFENVNIKYQVTRKLMEDPLLKKVLSTNKNTMLHSIRRSVDNLPLINSLGKAQMRQGNHVSYNQNISNSGMHSNYAV